LFTVIVTLDVRPDDVPEFTEIIRQNARLSLEREPGCLGFDVTVSTEVSGRFYLYEKYTDESAFLDDHRNAPHYEDFIARSTPLIVPGSKIVLTATELPSREDVVTP